MVRDPVAIMCHMYASSAKWVVAFVVFPVVVDVLLTCPYRRRTSDTAVGATHGPFPISSRTMITRVTKLVAGSAHSYFGSNVNVKS